MALDSSQTLKYWSLPLPEPFRPLFLLLILSLCPFLNSALPPGSAGTLLFLQLQGANSQREEKALLRGRVPNAQVTVSPA